MGEWFWKNISVKCSLCQRVLRLRGHCSYSVKLVQENHAVDLSSASSEIDKIDVQNAIYSKKKSERKIIK